MMTKQLLLASLALATSLAADYTPAVAIISHPYNSTHESIPGSYVKWLEMGGARATRMPYNADNELVEMIVNNTDGIFFIGGSGLLPASAKHAYSLITELQGEAE